MFWPREHIIYILINEIEVNKLFSFLSSWCFLKQIENMYHVSIELYKHYEWKFGEREMQLFRVLPNFHEYQFYFLNINNINNNNNNNNNNLILYSAADHK